MGMSGTYTCGSLSSDFVFSGSIPYVIHMVIIIIKFIIPVILIIFGSIDFLKAVTAAKEDEIKKGQQTFIKRVIAALIVFFIVQIVQLLVRFIASGNDPDNQSIRNCFDCFINNGDSCRKIS